MSSEYHEVPIDWRKKKRSGIKKARYVRAIISRKILRRLRGRDPERKNWAKVMMWERKWTLEQLQKWARGEWNKPPGGSLSRAERGMKIWNRRNLNE